MKMFYAVLVVLLSAITLQQVHRLQGQETRIERQRQVIIRLVVQLDQTKRQLNTARKNCPVYPPAIPREPLKRSI